MIDALAAAVESMQERGRERGGHPWWWWVAGIVIAVIGLAVGAWYLSQDRRELARLRHERFRLEQEQRGAQINAQIAADKQIALEAEARAQQATVEIAAVELAIQASKLRHAQDLAAVDRIRSWRDVAPDHQ